MFFNKYFCNYLIVPLFVFALSACGAEVISTNDDDDDNEPVTADYVLRQQVAGDYLIDCYNLGGKSFKHLITMTSGDINNGTYIIYEHHYTGEDCVEENIIVLSVSEAKSKFGPVSGIDEDNEFYSNIDLDGTMVNAAKLNITTLNQKLTIYDEALIAAAELEYGMDFTVGEEVVVSEEEVNYYTHAYFPEDISSVTVAPFMPAATDHRATYAIDGFVTAVKIR